MVNDLAYWLSIAVVAIVAVVTFKLLAASAVGEKIPGLAELGDFI
jgi:predicted exporter